MAITPLPYQCPNPAAEPPGTWYLEAAPLHTTQPRPHGTKRTSQAALVLQTLQTPLIVP